MRFLSTTSLTSLLLAVLMAFAFVVSMTPASLLAAPNLQINYQGKLTDDAGATVANGQYGMEFKLYTDPTGGSAIWTENSTSTVTNGLFSVMLGSSTSLASVDFNQTLYLGVNIQGDGEMSPRKIIGTVPAAFEARRLDGIASSSFLRSDQADTASGLLTFTGGLLSNSSSTITDLTSITATTTNLVVNGERFTDLTGTGLENFSNTLRVATTTLGLGNGTFLGLSDTPGSYTANALLHASSDGSELTNAASMYSDGRTLSLSSALSTENVLLVSNTGAAVLADRLGSTTASITDNFFVSDSPGDRSGNTLDIYGVYSASSAAGSVSGSSLDVQRDSRGIFSGGNITVTGALASFTDTCTIISGGTCTSSADVMQLTQSTVENTGTVLNITSASTNGGYVFRVNDDGTLTDDSPFLIDSAGDTMIGTTTSRALLTVDGDLFVGTSSLPTLFADVSTGRVGIGTTTPSRMLTVAGDTWLNGALYDSVNNSAGVAGYVLQSTSNGTEWVATSSLGISGGSSLWTESGSDIYFDTGNVGVGTSSPNSRLTVAGNINVDDTNSGLSGLFVNQLPVVTASSTSQNFYFAGATSTSFTSGATSNFAFGQGALNSLTTGDYNVGFGPQTMQNLTTGGYNFAVGYQALRGSSTANYTGSNAVALGYQTMGNATGGYENFAGGYRSLYNNSSGNHNVGLGYATLLSNTSGNYNIALGNSVLYNNVSGSDNIGFGNSALYSNTTGTNNIALGPNVLYDNTTGSNNTALGWRALNHNVSGVSNNAIGYQALQNTDVWSYNNAFGQWALQGVDGDYNLGLGNNAGQFGTGNHNIAIGYEALTNTTGTGTIAIGYQTAKNSYEGDHGIFIGYGVSAQSNTDNILNIGNLIFGTGVDGTGTTLSSGNIGIGTTTPSSKLDVWGDFRVGTSSLATLFADTSTGRVGIGTTSPKYHLHIEDELSTVESVRALVRNTSSGSLALAGYMIGNDTKEDGAGIWLNGSGNTGGLGEGDDLNVINLITGANLNFGTEQSVDMTIDSDGNVGIGTTTPTYSKLHIARTDTPSDNIESGIFSDWRGDVASDGYSIGILGKRVNTGSTVVNGTYHNIGVMGWAEDNANGGSDLFGLEGRVDGHSGSDLDYRAMYALARWFDETPGDATTFTGTLTGLHIDRQILNNNESTPRNEGLSYGAFINDVTGSHTNVGLYIAPQTGGSAVDVGLSLGAADTASLWISSNADNTTPNAGMFFGSSLDTNLYRGGANMLRTSDSLVVDGNLGIGTTTPNSRLSIAQAADSNGLSISGFDDRSTSSGELYVDSDGVFTVNASGPVGFGYLAGNGTPVASWNDSRITVADNKEMSFGDSSDYSWGYNSADDSIRLVDGNNVGTDGNARLTVLSSGNVGVGTTTPNRLFTVAGDTWLNGALYDSINNSAGVAGYVLQSTSNGTEWVATSSLGISGGGGSSLFTDGGSTTYLTSLSDSLAVGTDTASAKLSVAQSADASGISIAGFDDRSTSIGQLYVDSSGVFTVNASGPVGFGYLASGGTPVAAWNSNLLVMSDNKELAFGDGNDYSWGYHSASDSIRLVDGANVATDANARLTVLNSGNVGIGTTTPGYRLSVAGDFFVGTSSLGTLFADVSTGRVGIGTTTPQNRLSVLETIDSPQVRVSYDGSRFATFKVDSAGDLVVAASGGNTFFNDDNVFICTGGSCPGGDPTGTGNLFIENKLGLGTTTPAAPLDVWSGAGAKIAQFFATGVDMLVGILTFDSTPATDHSASGNTVKDIAASTTIAIGESVYLNSAGAWGRADATSSTTVSHFMGIAIEAGSNGEDITVATDGAYVRDDSWSWTTGGTVYASTSPGVITQTAPSGSGNVVRIIGTATSQNVIKLEFGSIIVLN